MSWPELVAILAEAVGPAEAERVASVIRAKLGGCRLTVPTRRHVTPQEAEQAAPGKPREAARKLGVHPSTVYRLLQRRPLR